MGRCRYDLTTDCNNKDCVKCVLDKISTEIEELDRYYDNDYFSTNNCPMYKCNEVLLIIDKYRGDRHET